MEGIMMRHGDEYSIAVRKPNKEIEVKVEPYRSFIKNKRILSLPVIRGVFSFIDSLVVGTRCLMYSASFFEEEEEPGKKSKGKARAAGENEEEAREQTADGAGSRQKEQNNTDTKEKEHREPDPKEERREKWLMYGTVAFSILLSIGIFMLLPYLITELARNLTESKGLLSFIESAVRVAIFLLYLFLISRMKDIQRTFEYHGAEHKCINCIEHGLELNVENVLKSSREHKRCGTSFLFFVMLVSIVFQMFIRVDSHLWSIVIRLALIPVIAGVSFEIIRLAGRTDNRFINLLSKPGLMLQHMTTREPDAEEAQVAIAAVEAVFDWRAYLAENFGYVYEENARETEQEKEPEMRREPQGGVSAGDADGRTA